MFICRYEGIACPYATENSYCKMSACCMRDDVFVITDDKVEAFLKATKESNAYEKMMERAKRNGVKLKYDK